MPSALRSRIRRAAAAMTALATLAGPPASQAQSSPGIPLEVGLTVTSTLVFPDGDRDNVVVVRAASADGVSYLWHVRERTKGGEVDHSFTRFVRSADLRGAPRLNYFFREGETESHPGFTAFSISTATYDSLMTSGSTRYTMVELKNVFGQLGKAVGALGSLFTSTETLKGRLTAVSRSPEPYSVLINGRRVTVPALRLGGRFGPETEPLIQQFWVLADRTHPLILRIVTGADVFEVTRIDLPASDRGLAVERDLATSCRAELPGIYFAFGSADLDPASTRALQSAAAMLDRHRDWRLTIEGHTDSIGQRSAHLALSRRRAEAVRNALISAHGVPADRLGATGLGDSHPREPNGTVAGRARNRRVEITRTCSQENR